MKLAITRIVLWFIVSIVLFRTLLAALKGDASWTDYASLIVALACLLFVYMKAIAHFTTARADRAKG
jgi:hypothetical protein